MIGPPVVARMYKNGMLALEQSFGVFTPRTNLPLFLGRYRDGGDYYSGTLDEISLYTRPLDIGEIRGIYAAGASGKVLDRNQRPVVSAGANVDLLSPSATGTLAGSIVDDGKPADGVLTSIWTKWKGRER